MAMLAARMPGSLQSPAMGAVSCGTSLFFGELNDLDASAHGDGAAGRCLGSAAASLDDHRRTAAARQHLLYLVQPQGAAGAKVGQCHHIWGLPWRVRRRSWAAGRGIIGLDPLSPPHVPMAPRQACAAARATRAPGCARTLVWPSVYAPLVSRCTACTRTCLDCCRRHARQDSSHLDPPNRRPLLPAAAPHSHLHTHSHPLTPTPSHTAAPRRRAPLQARPAAGRPRPRARRGRPSGAPGGRGLRCHSPHRCRRR